METTNTPILTSEGQPFKTDGYLTICNSVGIEIMLNRSQDGVYYLFTGDTEPEESEIQYDQEGEPYFLINTTAYYLNQFIKINR